MPRKSYDSEIIVDDPFHCYLGGKLKGESMSSHPDIIKLYDDIEDLIYRFFKDIDEWKGKTKAEKREIIRQNLVSDIGQAFVWSPYFNKKHPLYVSPTPNGEGK